ncbi:hypothetical protein H7H37_04605, partial [Mycolicibacterium insubricum]|nr:hypothetical protein [Mycolicibacterium insubricum]
SGDPELLAHYRELAADHLEVLAGDKGEENLGLDPTTWARLAAIRPTLVPDTLATLTALHADPGLPDTGVIALLDFGASGTGLTLVDAATGFTPIGETQRLPFSGDEVDAAVLRAVLTDLERHGDVDPAATAAVGSLVRLRHECRVAKERLSAEPAVSLVAALTRAPQRGAVHPGRTRRPGRPGAGRRV